MPLIYLAEVVGDKKYLSKESDPSNKIDFRRFQADKTEVKEFSSLESAKKYIEQLGEDASKSYLIDAEVFWYVLYELENVRIMKDLKDVRIVKEATKPNSTMEQLLESIDDLFAVIDESKGIIGWHLNGKVADWDEFEFIDSIRQLSKKAKEELTKPQ